MPGIIPWFFISEAISNGTNSVITYDYLVKKVVFKVSALPVIKITSSFIVHIALVLIMIIIFIIHGYYPTIYWLQIPYFIFATYILVLGISWLTSSLNVFTKDINQIVAVILQLGFWLTPIIWEYSMVANYKLIAIIFKLNPAFYIVEGYRNSLIYEQFFWDVHWVWTMYFWCFTLLMLAIGGIVFKKLRPHFADVL